MSEMISGPLTEPLRSEFREAANETFENVLSRTGYEEPDMIRTLWDVERYLDTDFATYLDQPISKDYALSLIDAFMPHHVFDLIELAGRKRAIGGGSLH